MICVLPFCQKDVHLALESLAWCKELGGCPNHDALLVADAGTDWGACREALTLANDTFRLTKIITTPEPVDSWKAGSNALFKEAAICCEKGNAPFFFLEPDAVPLKPGWLNEIEEAYSECGMPFMGPLVKHHTAGFPSPYLEGIAVYPADCWSRFKDVWSDEESWCIACASVSARQAMNTPLVHQIWGQQGIAVSFVPALTIHSQPQDKTIDFISPQAVVFHRCKDSSLIHLLRGRLFPDRPDYTNPPAFVQMGRFGDLILLMPAFKAWSERSGTKTVVVTSREFGTVLEGASYVQPIMMKHSWYEAGQARNWAQAHYPRVIVTQLHGSDIPTIPDDLKSYSFSMWHRTGLLDEYDSLPLVFDQRVREREKTLIDAHVKPGKPIILTKFDGWTSPFDGGAAIRQRLEYWNHAFQVIDLGNVRAHRIFDLLGLFDIATGLITADTFTLHLAPASDLQYIAYTRDDGQSGSVPKGNCVWSCGYSQWDKQMDAFDLQMNLWACHPKAITL